MTKPLPIEFYFDFSSPYSYLASELIDPLAAKYGRKVTWRPIMIGAAFKATGSPFLLTVPLKGEYSKRDIERSARYYGVPYRFPRHFPALTLTAARAYYWLHAKDCAQARAFAHAGFRALWVDDRNVAEADVIGAIATDLGLDAAELLAAANSPEAKERVKQETETAITKGMFGAPYFIIDDEPFWGADRLPQIEKWLETGGF